MTERRLSSAMMAVLVLVCSTFSYVAGVSGWFPRVEQVVVGVMHRVTGPGSTGDVDLTQIRRVQQFIQQRHLEPVSAEKMTQGALKGMVDSIGDKYSSYFTPSEYKRFRESLESSFTGIGVHVETSAKTGLVTVVAPIKGSPGDQAGLRAGDAIISVDDRDVTHMTLDEAVSLIRGPEGSKVKLTVRRPDQQDSLYFMITRATITTPSLDYEMLDQESGIGYVQVREFNRQIAERVSAALTELEGKGMKRLILDLRRNPGGLLDEAVQMASLFVPEKEPIVHIVQRNGQKETYRSQGSKHWQLPMVLLVDGGSASASEIVAGTIKDLKAGVLMGVKTFGKGVVQTFYDMEDGSGLKLTTAKYLTAGGNSIHEKGITPDIVVENPQQVQPHDPGDVQLEAAVRYVKTMKR